MEPELTDEGPNAPDRPAASGILDAADLRFLLPEPIRSASVTRPAPALEAALAAAGVELVPAGAGPADVLFAAGDPAGGDAGCVVLSGRRAAARLERHGYVAHAYVPLPSRDVPALVLPLSAPAAALYALDHWTFPEGAVRRARAAAARLVVRWGAAPPLRPPFAVGLRREAAPFLIAAAAEVGVPPGVDFFLRSGQGDTLSRSVFFLFRSGDAAPAWALKFARVRGYRAPFDADEAGLRLAAEAGAADGGRAPHLLGRFEVDGFAAAVETAAVGRPLSEVLRGAASEREKLDLVDSIAGWILELEGRTRSPAAGLAGELERLAALAAARDSPLPPELVARVGPVPGTVQHNDLGSWNVIVAGRSFTVVDWEGASRPGLPLWDLWYFLADIAAALDGVAFADRNAHLVSLFRGDGRLSQRLFDWTRRGAESLGIPAASVGPLTALCWLHHSASHGKRAELLAAHGPSVDEPRRFERPFPAGWLSDPRLGLDWPAWRA